MVESFGGCGDADNQRNSRESRDVLLDELLNDRRGVGLFSSLRHAAVGLVDDDEELRSLWYRACCG